jgi:hypothetical protein
MLLGFLLIFGLFLVTIFLPCAGLVWLAVKAWNAGFRKRPAPQATMAPAE